jgi:hypothetical protein
MKINFISNLKSSLITARNQPQIGPTFGVSWITSSQFAVNSQKLADQWQITSNDLCYNFRSHGFTTESARGYRDAIKSLGAPRNCRLHRYEGLSQMTIETVFDGIHWMKPKPIPGRKIARKLKFQMPQQTETARKTEKMDHPDMIGREFTGPDGANTATGTSSQVNLWDELDRDESGLFPMDESDLNEFNMFSVSGDILNDLDLPEDAEDSSFFNP